MKILEKTAVLAAAVFAFSVCPASAQDESAERAAIEAINVAWGVQYNAGDADAVADLYWEDAVLLAPGAPARAGRAAIREFLAREIAGARATGIVNNIDQATEIGFVGDIAWQNGTFSVTDASGATLDTGKYLSVLEKRDGKWRLVRDTWNSDVLPDPAAVLQQALNAFMGGWNAGDFAGMDGYVATDFRRDAPGMNADGLAAIKKVMLDLRTAYPDMKVVLDESHFMTDENMSFHLWTFTGTNTGEGAMPPTGKSVKLSGATLMRYRDGKIIEENVVMDRLGWMEQLGQMPTSATGGMPAR